MAAINAILMPALHTPGASVPDGCMIRQDHAGPSRPSALENPDTGYDPD